MENKQQEQFSEMPIIDNNREAIKLIKNSKSFGWEIKLLGDVSKEQFERIKEINLWFQNEFNGKDDGND